MSRGGGCAARPRYARATTSPHTPRKTRGDTTADDDSGLAATRRTKQLHDRHGVKEEGATPRAESAGGTTQAGRGTRNERLRRASGGRSRGRRAADSAAPPCTPLGRCSQRDRTATASAHTPPRRLPQVTPSLDEDDHWSCVLSTVARPHGEVAWRSRHTLRGVHRGGCGGVQRCVVSAAPTPRPRSLARSLALLPHVTAMHTILRRCDATTAPSLVPLQGGGCPRSLQKEPRSLLRSWAASRHRGCRPPCGRWDRLSAPRLSPLAPTSCSRGRSSYHQTTSPKVRCHHQSRAFHCSVAQSQMVASVRRSP